MKPLTYLVAACILCVPPPAFADPNNQPKPVSDTLAAMRGARCNLALCTNDQWFAVELLVELPVGKTFALGSTNSLSNWINSHNLDAKLAGGLRFWGFHDWASISVYSSAPLTEGGQTVYVPGSEYEHPTSNIRRPYPGLALGLFGDSLWIGFDYQKLVNGDTRSRSDVNYAPNQTIAEAWSVTVGLATVTGIRSGLGAANAASKKSTDDENGENATEEGDDTQNEAAAIETDSGAKVIDEGGSSIREASGEETAGDSEPAAVVVEDEAAEPTDEGEENAGDSEATDTDPPPESEPQ